jgi:hypothetical protein
MPTVNEVLKSSGLTDEQIAALDAKVVAGVTQILSTADQTLADAQREKRAVAETFEKEINPALNKWANDSASLTAERDYYKTLAEKAKEGGFTPNVEPFKPPVAERGADGKFVAGAPGATPGSPTFVADLRKEAGAAIGSMLDLNWKYQSLYGQPMPDSPTSLIAEAQAQRMNPIEYAAKKYDFAGKEKAKKDAEQKAHDDAIRKEASDAKDKEWAEKTGNNPMMRQAETSRFSEVAKATKEGKRPDTMTMTPDQRRDFTRQQIHKEIAANESVN